MKQTFDPKISFVFTGVFGNREEKSTIIDFLNSVIKTPDKIVDVEYLEKDLNPDTVFEDSRRVDVKAVTENGDAKYVTLIMQSEYNKSNRTRRDWKNISFADFLLEGERINKNICIYILDYIYFEGHKRYHNVFLLPKEKEGEKDLEIHFIELPKILEIEKRDPLTAWGMFLKEPNHPDVLDAKYEILGLKKAVYRLAQISSNDNNKYRYDSSLMSRLDGRSAYSEAMRRGKEEGRRTGKKLSKLFSAVEALEEGEDLEKISKENGLSIELLKLLKDME